MTTKAGREPTDEVRGFGGHDSRVPFNDVSVREEIDRRTVHPIDAIEWGDEPEDMDAVIRERTRRGILDFLGHWLKASTSQRTAVAHRATGSSLDLVGKAMMGKSAQAADKAIKNAIKQWPNLAFAFRDMQHQQPTKGK